MWNNGQPMQTRNSIPELCAKVIKQGHAAQSKGYWIRQKIEHGGSAIRVKKAQKRNEQPTVVVYFRGKLQQFCAISLKIYQAESGEHVIDRITLITHAQLPGEPPPKNTSTARNFRSLAELERFPEFTRIVRQSLENFLHALEYRSGQPPAPTAAGTAQPNPRTAGAGQRGGRGGGKGRRVGFLRGRRR